MEFKIMFLGPANVGKTSIICQYCNELFQEDTMPTIGAGFSTQTVQIGENTLTLHLWDTAGEERFRSVTPALIHGAHGLVLVYDVTNPEFSETEIYWKMFIDNTKTDISETLPILLIGNKIDVVRDQSDSIESFNQKMKEIKDEAIEWCQQHDITHLQFVSAKTGENITESITEFSKSLIHPIRECESNLLPSNVQKSQNCC